MDRPSAEKQVKMKCYEQVMLKTGEFFPQVQLKCHSTVGCKTGA